MVPGLSEFCLRDIFDDGTSGLKAVKSCGGTCIIQDPEEAEYPDMPRNALNNVNIDYCLPISDMGTLLDKLIRRKLRKQKPTPEDVIIEAKIAQRVLSDLSSVDAVGNQVPFNCPGCGGFCGK